jgi:hypothetical protein
MPASSSATLDASDRLRTALQSAPVMGNMRAHKDDDQYLIPEALIV